jgi:hypothetical protein
LQVVSEVHFREGLLESVNVSNRAKVVLDLIVSQEVGDCQVFVTPRLQLWRVTVDNVNGNLLI